MAHCHVCDVHSFIFQSDNSNKSVEKKGRIFIGHFFPQTSPLGFWLTGHNVREIRARRVEIEIKYYCSETLPCNQT